MFRAYIMFIFNICSRYLLWAVGVIIFFLMIYNCFFSYGITLGTNVHIGVQPLLTICIYDSGIGEKLVTLLWGGYFVSQTALEPLLRFHIFFYLLYYWVFVFLHIILLHVISFKYIITFKFYCCIQISLYLITFIRLNPAF